MQARRLARARELAFGDVAMGVSVYSSSCSDIDGPVVGLDIVAQQLKMFRLRWESGDEK